jgi:hypothetical protein
VLAELVGATEWEVDHVSASRYPTATVAERLALGSACAVALAFLLLGWYLPAAAAFVLVGAVLVAQQLRENRCRRLAIQELWDELPAMTSSE